MRLKSAVSALAMVAFIAACGAKTSSEHHGEAEAGHGEAAAHGAHGPSLGPAEAHAATTSHDAHAPQPAAHTGAHWSYTDQTAWARIAGANVTCETGLEQSPINLASAAPVAELADLTPRYLPLEGAFVNNGHTLQFTPAASEAMLTIGQDAYTLAQFHFHSPAEHTVDRMSYPVELHFVHRNGAGRLAVVGVFIEEGMENPALAALIAARPHGEGEEAATHASLDPNALLPADHTYFAYAGSLTTPPCSEGVRWNVMRQPITASAAQIAALREALGASARHPQPLHQRTVLLGS